MSCCMFIWSRHFSFKNLCQWNFFLFCSCYVSYTVFLSRMLCTSLLPHVYVTVLYYTWAFYFVIPLSSSLFILELLLIVSFHSFVSGRMWLSRRLYVYNRPPTLFLWLHSILIKLSLTLHGLCYTSSLFPPSTFSILIDSATLTSTLRKKEQYFKIKPFDSA